MFQHALGSAVMDLIGGEHRNSGMSMSVLYQGKNDRQKATAAVMSRKRPGKPGWYFRA